MIHDDDRLERTELLGPPEWDDEDEPDESNDSLRLDASDDDVEAHGGCGFTRPE